MSICRVTLRCTSGWIKSAVASADIDELRHAASASAIISCSKRRASLVVTAQRYPGLRWSSGVSLWCLERDVVVMTIVDDVGDRALSRALCPLKPWWAVLGSRYPSFHDTHKLSRYTLVAGAPSLFSPIFCQSPDVIARLRLHSLQHIYKYSIC